MEVAVCSRGSACCIHTAYCGSSKIQIASPVKSLLYKIISVLLCTVNVTHSNGYSIQCIFLIFKDQFAMFFYSYTILSFIFLVLLPFCERLLPMNFMVAPCISNIKHFIFQLMQTNCKILRLLK